MSDNAQKRYQAALEKLSRDLVDRGLLIEAGWIGLRAMILPPHASEVQIKEMRLAFFAGAQHLFGSINSILDPGPDIEPTEDDLRRMQNISDELDRFVAEVGSRLPVAGRA